MEDKREDRISYGPRRADLQKEAAKLKIAGAGSMTLPELKAEIDALKNMKPKKKGK